MIDFLMISYRSPKKDVIEIYPKFIIKESSDLMIRGGDFYAIWVAERNLWSTKEQDALMLIDRELDRYYEENKSRFGEDCRIKVKHMWDAESGMIDAWHKYCQRQMRDQFHMLDEQLIFSNTDTKKEDYASKKLPYPLAPGETHAWDQLLGTLYAPEERHKIEWAIGAIVSGDSKKLQKFMVLYGAAGTGKSTVLNIIQALFAGYTSVFDAKALGSASNAFALECFRSNPLVAIQHDGDLSHIEDNTRLNSLVSHESMSVNEKFKATYENSFKAFLFMGTNKPVKITDAKSGLIRRLIDVSPTGNKLDSKTYHALKAQIAFELGAIAQRCLEVYQAQPGRYDDYVPMSMLGASNDFYNFVQDSWFAFSKEDETTLKSAWEMYKTYCEDAKVAYPYNLRAFKEELKNYFRDYFERTTLPDGTRLRSYYRGFLRDKFEAATPPPEIPPMAPVSLGMAENVASVFDDMYAACPAQYANEKGMPRLPWDQVTTRLRDLDTHKLHYVLLPDNHVVIDFDLRGENGEKSFERNAAAAAKWPQTYAEVSKSGAGIHLHYLYTGDVTRLQRLYAENVEVKIFTGKSALRRKLSRCNAIPVATISSGLPTKEVSPAIDFKAVENEKMLRAILRKGLEKKVHAFTKPSMDFIRKVLDDAYYSGMVYDVSDLENRVIAFAAQSTNHAEYCLRLIDSMHFRSQGLEDTANRESKNAIVFYDVEVFPNLLVVVYKTEGKAKPKVRLINPTRAQIGELFKFRLIGFNCRKYDNHILYGALIGYTNAQLYDLSQRIVQNHKDCYFGQAYNISYTDIYDFAAAANKKSLKKLEIEMGIHHQELGLPWDQPVPKEKWPLVADYCENDVDATEAAFHYLSADFTARKILADIAGMTVNDTTNTLTTRIIFGAEKHPQSQFRYRNLALPVRPEDLREDRPKKRRNRGEAV